METYYLHSMHREGQNHSLGTFILLSDYLLASRGRKQQRSALSSHSSITESMARQKSSSQVTSSVRPGDSISQGDQE